MLFMNEAFFPYTFLPQNKTPNITTTTQGCDFCDATKERSLFAAPQKKTLRLLFVFVAFFYVFFVMREE